MAQFVGAQAKAISPHFLENVKLITLVLPLVSSTLPGLEGEGTECFSPLKQDLRNPMHFDDLHTH